jgi:GT2 family glycosyltransferase
MSVAVVTPWRGHEELREGYMSLIEAGGPDRLIIVDDGSQPPLEFAQARLRRPLGFCKACNWGLRLAQEDVVVFLNNDVELAGGYGWLQKLSAAVEPGVLVGPQLRSDPHCWVEGVPFPYLDGWCLAGMREDFETLGGWDETLEEPAYYSDNMLCLRARLAGMTLREVRLGIRHLGNGTSRPDDPAVIAATLANQARYREVVGSL